MRGVLDAFLLIICSYSVMVTLNSSKVELPVQIRLAAPQKGMTNMSVYTCPVCNGRGFVPCGFYLSQTYDGSSVTDSTSTELCRSCGGRGIIFDECLRAASNNGQRICSNCEMNDGMVYTSYPPKYRCTISGHFNEGTYLCDLDDVMDK